MLVRLTSAVFAVGFLFFANNAHSQLDIEKHANNIQQAGRNLGKDLLMLDVLPSEIKDCLFVSGEAFKTLAAVENRTPAQQFSTDTRMMIVFAWSYLYNNSGIDDWATVLSLVQEMSRDSAISSEDYFEAMYTRLKVCDSFVRQAVSARKTMGAK